MSIRLGSVGLFFSLIAIAFAANQADLEDHTNSRAPASIQVLHKQEKLGAFKTGDEIRHTQKLRGPLSVKLEMVGPTPQVGDTFMVRATIGSRRALNSAGYQWSLPSELELINGQLTGTVDNVDASPTVELTLKKLSADNAQIHLMASAAQGDVRFGDSTVLNTDKKTTNVATKAAVLNGVEIEVPAANKAKNSNLKIFH